MICVRSLTDIVQNILQVQRLQVHLHLQEVGYTVPFEIFMI